ncbi:oxidoreductase [Patulibacter minatonensis]|uniref:oxidoreductase n=1 Tax=Patulibacter minatonensis TaxID=298163 RepID=UPI00055ED995|nr:oxidoreductase [Patulibacter minatonensis]
MPKWNASNLPSFSGRTVVVTGANSGIGLVAARELARAGARTVIAVRDPAKGERAAAGITGDVEVRRLDLADLSSVRAFAAEWEGDLDVLVNNAGVMIPPRGTTKDGFELQIGTNHLGHFALTNLLLPKITERVVTVASGAHRGAKVDLDDLNWERREFKNWAAYGQSKLANLLFTLELERRLRAAGSPVRALAAHPGYAATNLQSATTNPFQRIGMKVANRVVAQDDAAGALPTLFAASQDLPGASYVGPDGLAEMRGGPVLVGRTAEASDAESAKRLWSLSEELTGVRAPELLAV